MLIGSAIGDASGGPEGTITDDTRFKLILFNTLKNYDGELTQQNFAQSVMDFRETLTEKYKDNYDDWMYLINKYKH